jgi:enoyl-CoA hydratase
MSKSAGVTQRRIERNAMIERSVHDGILTMRLAHGKASALDVEILEAFSRELDATTDARAVILTGTGSIFSAGVDLFRLTAEGTEYLRRFLALLSELLVKLFSYPKPVIAAVNGHAIAGGCILVLAADYRLMAEGEGRIGVPELLVGVPFPTVPLEVVRFVVPADHIQSLIYMGRTLLPRDALAQGLLDEVVDPDALDERAQRVAHQFAAIPPEAFRLTKQYLRAAALERMTRADGRHDAGALTAWSAPETHAHIRAYLARTVRGGATSA